MNQQQRMSPRARILVSSVKTLQDRDAVYGEPRTPLSCAGELKRVFLKYAARSPRQIGPGEHEAMDLALTKIARIATGPSVHEDNYVDGAAYLALAGEAALVGTTEARSVMDREAEAEATAEADDLQISQQDLLEESKP
jgi:Domain of unknown function (DUF6378)